MKKANFCNKQVFPIFIILSFFCSLYIPSLAHAEVLGPGWYTIQGESVSIEEARAYYVSEVTKPTKVDSVREENVIVRLGSGCSGCPCNTDQSPEITALARGLQCDPDEIYNYVHNHIDYVPYFGARKGATLTYLDGSGNDFDQASLMIALLRASGYSTRYVYGAMEIPISDIANWFGVEANNEIITRILEDGAIPHNPPVQQGTDTLFEMARM